MTERSIDVHIPTITRVEGEGALHLAVDDGVITDLRLEIYEPPRFFESLLRGRGFEEPIDVTARICGICPVAYQMSAINALESIAGVTVDGPLRSLRRLLYAGEWIESHVLHIGFLHAPDFLGVESGIELAGRDRALVEQILRLKQLGNRIVEVLGGRPIHPINVRLGGFHRLPTDDELAQLADPLDRARDDAIDLTRRVAAFDFPDLTVSHELVSLRHADEYPMLDGRLVSDRGLDIDPAEFDEHFVEEQVGHSTALHARRRSGDVILTGPLARWTNNHDLLPPEIVELGAELGVGKVERNPFRSIIVRCLEVLLAIDEARRIIASPDRPTAAARPVPPTAGVGWGASEAPRGTLHHRYETSADGTILSARIIPPTSQNQPAIEADVRSVVERHVAALGTVGAGTDTATDSESNTVTDTATDAESNIVTDTHSGGGEDELRHRCEVAIRNHDPCISCAAHFLRLHIDR